MLLDGDPQWQRYLFYAATAFLIWEIWRGWRLGAVRGLLRLAALFCAWIAGTTTAGATGTVVAFFSKVPPLFAPVVAGLVVAVGIYIVISLLSRILFKTTLDHSGVVRWGFGLGGALCGAIYGLLLLWGGITMIRGLGALGELRVVQARNEGRPVASERSALFLIKLKESLEMGATGKTLRKADPLPTSFYDNIVKISMLAGSQQALERFCQYPETLKIIANTNISALLQDPELEKAANSRNILPLLHNKHVQAAMNDPQLVAEFQKFPLTAALDYALEPAAPQRHVPPPAKNLPRNSPRGAAQGKNGSPKSPASSNPTASQPSVSNP
jgi:hypothetical protein